MKAINEYEYEVNEIMAKRNNENKYEENDNEEA